MGIKTGTGFPPLIVMVSLLSHWPSMLDILFWGAFKTIGNKTRHDTVTRRKMLLSDLQCAQSFQHKDSRFRCDNIVSSKTSFLHCQDTVSWKSSSPHFLLNAFFFFLNNINCCCCCCWASGRSWWSRIHCSGPGSPGNFVSKVQMASGTCFQGP